MAILNPPAFMQNAGATHSAELTRQAMGMGQAGPRSAASMVPRSGVHPHLGGMMAVTQNGSPNMSVNVANGVAFIGGSEGQQSGYVVCATSTTNVTITAAHASLPRIDIIVANIRDSAYSGANNDWQLQAIAGTPAGSPTVPTAPANSIVLAQVAVAAAATTITNANITDVRPYSAYGVTVCRSTADYPNPAVEGMVVYDMALNGLATYDGTTWTNPRGVQFWQRVIFTASGTFTKASYAGLKKVFVQVQGAGGGGGGSGAAGVGADSCGSGGGGGAYAESWLDASALASSVTVTVGTGGAGGVGAANGTAGGSSSFGAHVVCAGGALGVNRPANINSFATAGGAGGAASAGDVRVAGGAGQWCYGDASYAAGGTGGHARMGGGGVAPALNATSSNASGNAGGLYGGGGSGAATTASGAAATGGAGAAGIVIVDLYI